MKRLVVLTTGVLSLACTPCRATDVPNPSPDPAATTMALRKLISIAQQPILKTSGCHGDYGQTGPARVADLLVTRLAYLYNGDNRVEGTCTATACSVSIHHAAGEDVASATIQFDLKRGVPQASSLHCVLTP